MILSFSKKYAVPSLPHVTVLSKIEAEETILIEKVKMIANISSQIEVGIFGINFSSTIHQAVFAQIKMSAELLSLYEALETTLRYFPKQPFFPHMSFTYGEFSPEEKANIATTIQVGKKLLLDKILIFRDGPLASDWARVAELKLN
jgi:hypothetical protein